MPYKLEELIDLNILQEFQEKLWNVSPFPTGIIDNDGNILTAVGWQDVCTKFHRAHPDSEKECIKSDQYVAENLHKANPAVIYTCPHGMTDSATPIVIEGRHLGNFFIGQMFLEKPDIEYYRAQAKKYDFDEKSYLEAVSKVPVWSNEKLNQHLGLIKWLIEIIATSGLRRLKELETNKILQQEIEERKMMEQKIAASLSEKEVLLKEIHHRVKNNLQLISSLLMLQRDYLEDPDGRRLFSESISRVRSMALIHEKFYRAEEMASIEIKGYLTDFIKDLERFYSLDKGLIQIHLDFEEIYLSIDQAIPVGLIFNELVSNCMKHAFPSGTYGNIRLQFHKNQELYELIVSDDGVGIKRGMEIENLQTLGITLVNGLVSQLKGSMEIKVDSGVSFKINIPVKKENPS